MATLHAAQTPSSLSTSSFGRLRLAITSYGTGRPIENASIQIANTGQPDQVIEEVTTDVTGQTTSLELSAPPVEYSLEPSANQPYSEYNFLIQAPGYEALEINSAEILAGETAIQNAALIPTVEEDSAELYVIPPHTLFYDCLLYTSDAADD